MRLEDLDGVTRLSALTRLTLLEVVKDGKVRRMTASVMGPPTFITALRRLRELSLHWATEAEHDHETIRCLATLSELERLFVRQLRRSPDHIAGGGSFATVGGGSGGSTAGVSSCARSEMRQHSRQEGGEEESRIGGLTCAQPLAVDESTFCQAPALEGAGSEDGVLGKRKRGRAETRSLGIRMVRPLVGLVMLRWLQVAGRWKMDGATQQRIQALRGEMGLPRLLLHGRGIGIEDFW